MKTKFTLNNNGSVTVEYTDVYGNLIVQKFYTVKSAGMSDVYYDDDLGNRKCLWRIGSRGQILRSTRHDLLATMRAEFRKLRAYNKKYVLKILFSTPK